MQALEISLLLTYLKWNKWNTGTNPVTARDLVFRSAFPNRNTGTPPNDHGHHRNRSPDPPRCHCCTAARPPAGAARLAHPRTAVDLAVRRSGGHRAGPPSRGCRGCRRLAAGGAPGVNAGEDIIPSAATAGLVDEVAAAGDDSIGYALEDGAGAYTSGDMDTKLVKAYIDCRG